MDAREDLHWKRETPRISARGELPVRRGTRLSREAPALRPGEPPNTSMKASARSGVLLVSIEVRLERAVLGNAEIASLLLGGLRQLDAELVQVQPRDFLIEMLRQDVHADRVLVVLAPQLHLRDHLIRERRRHDERRMPGS